MKKERKKGRLEGSASELKDWEERKLLGPKTDIKFNLLTFDPSAGDKISNQSLNQEENLASENGTESPNPSQAFNTSYLQIDDNMMISDDSTDNIYNEYDSMHKNDDNMINNSIANEPNMSKDNIDKGLKTNFSLLSFKDDNFDDMT